MEDGLALILRGFRHLHALHGTRQPAPVCPSATSKQQQQQPSWCGSCTSSAPTHA